MSPRQVDQAVVDDAASTSAAPNHSPDQYSEAPPKYISYAIVPISIAFCTATTGVATVPKGKRPSHATVPERRYPRPDVLE